MTKHFVLRNVKQVNEEKIDIVIHNGKIKAVVKAGEGKGNSILDFENTYVSSGWIDLHVHAFPEFEPYGDEIDQVGIKQGVTTIADAGSCGADRMEELVISKDKAKTNVYAYLNISRIGLQRVDELSNLEWIDKQKVLEAVNIYSDIIIGLKARISNSVVGDNGIEPLRRARQLSLETSLPLMVHIGSGPPSIEEISSLLEKDDVITHYLNGKENNLFDAQDRPLKAFLEALERGVQLDVGHGIASFSFKVAEAAKRHKIGLGTISTDMYRENRLNGPVYSMGHVLTKFLHLGYALEEVINAVTVNAAQRIKKPQLGRIKIGEQANLTLFKVKNEPVTLMDSEGEKRVSDKKIEPVGVVVNGEFIKC